MSEAQKTLLANVRAWRADQERRAARAKVEVVYFPKFRKLVEYEAENGKKVFMTVPGGTSK